MRQCDFAVEIFREGFQVNVGGVDVLVNIAECFASDVAVGDHDGFEAVFSGGSTNIDDVFAPDGRLVVGERQGVATILARQAGNVFGRDMLGAHLVVVGLGNVPVLAKEAAHVAAGGAHAEDARP